MGKKVCSIFLRERARFSSSTSNLLQEQTGSSQRFHRGFPPSIAEFLRLHPGGMGRAQRFQTCRVERWFYSGFTAGLSGGLPERLLCHLGCPPPLCCIMLKTCEQDCFKPELCFWNTLLKSQVSNVTAARRPFLLDWTWVTDCAVAGGGIVDKN